ncbi:hypothetical protein BDN71DRAFT_1443568 [Pleurotus eryngii]|uniref:Uncharacterized protein n=1 Tax=Pleurotus eryngii TaxID=5323 RepID=A0A9P6D9L6_PLEER|nr:hypothetical protein BDN71DRAFT_1443568 [Pleurotus eryngii]
MQPLQEPVWRKGPDAQYTRPLLGSELLLHQAHVHGDGMYQVCMGLTLKTSLGADSLIRRFRQALVYLRFVAPLVGATISDDEQTLWIYQPASSSKEVETWARNVFQVINDRLSPADFIQQSTERRLPYISDGDRASQQQCRFFLLTNPEYAFFVHGTHAIFDAHPTFNMFHILLEEIVRLRDVEPYAELPWGREGDNLPPGPATASGCSPVESSQMETLLRMVQTQLDGIVGPTMTFVPSQASYVKVHRIDAVVPPDETGRILSILKSHGYTVTHLVQAASVVAIYLHNKDLHGNHDQNSISLPGNPISLLKYNVAPYNRRSHITSSMAMVPIKVPVELISANDKDVVRSLIPVMEHIKSMYANYTFDPNLPCLHDVLRSNSRSDNSETLTQGPNVGITNIGNVDQMLPQAWYTEGAPTDHAPLIEVDDMLFGHRVGHYPGVIAHAWTMKKRIHYKVQANGSWDEGSLRNFVNRVVNLTTSFE